ncbi:MAG: phospholipase D-like domain-containing protein [Gammaproteobacteria bacterium]|nr:phospholipase D-like domain-containing protein [Gammaproteobacteria bacterium]
MNLLNRQETADTLVRLIDDHSEISFAVAWASDSNKVFEELQQNKNKKKIQHSVVGTHFFQTSPSVLQWCLDQASVRKKLRFYFANNSNSVFHPKIYLFWTTDKEWDLLIGSANLTVGGMDRNTELVLHVSSESYVDYGLYQDAKGTIKKYWKQSEVITKERLRQYESEHERKRPSRWVPPPILAADVPDILQMTWRDFYSEVKCAPAIGDPDRNPMIERLCLLTKAHEKFKEHSFMDLSEFDRRRLSATRQSEHSNEEWKTIRYRWFGSMHGMGKYSTFVRDKPESLSETLDAIPLVREEVVTWENFKNCYEEYDAGFGDVPHGLGLLTRLLSLKRPDIFVPWNNGNKKVLQKSLGIVRQLNDRDYKRYWDEIVARIHEDARWYKSVRPKGRIAGEVWDSRAAMLDAIVYKGSV